MGCVFGPLTPVLAQRTRILEAPESPIHHPGKKGAGEGYRYALGARGSPLPHGSRGASKPCLTLAPVLSREGQNG